LAARKNTTGVGDSRAILEKRALLAARALVDRMRALYRELEQVTGAPITLHRALVVVGNDPGLPASRLATQLGMQRPAVSQMLKNMEFRGWIERRRSATDQRAVQIHCTSVGRRVLQATSGRAVVTLQRAVCNLRNEQLANLATGVEKLLEELPEPTPAHPPSRRR
jgi:DNA-binding MarR family transcriptional regulator